MSVGIFSVRDWSSTLTLGGRLKPWVLGLAEWWTVSPWTGVGPGMWKNWVLWPDGVMAKAYGPSVGVFTEAFNEPLQILFEVGAIGFVLWGLFAAQCLLDAKTACRSDERMRQAWGMVVVMAGVSMWLTNLFHWPSQAMIVLFAAARIRGAWSNGEAWVTKVGRAWIR
jgi:O-antigen ligase